MEWTDLKGALGRLHGEKSRAQELGDDLTWQVTELIKGVKAGENDPVLALLLGKELSDIAQTTEWNSLILNPGSTSTKAAVYSGIRLVASADVHLVPGSPDGVEERVRLVLEWLDLVDESLSDLSGIAARGGFVAPVSTGTYRICDEMIEDLSKAPHEHASNMAVPMALELGKLVGSEVELTITDPVTCDEVDTVHRVTGSPDVITDGTACHYLNQRAVCTLVANLLGTDANSVHFISCHMGGGSSSVRFCDGRMVQVLPGFGSLPSANRAGALPLKDVVRLMGSRSYSVDDLKRDVVKSGAGLLALAGTNDFKVFLRFLEKSATPEQREKGDLLLDFFATRFAAGIMELAACQRPVEAVILTGGFSYSEDICTRVTSRLPLTIPIVRAPGTMATQALAAGLLKTCARSRSPKSYVSIRDNLRLQRDGEDEIIRRPIFTRPMLRRAAGSPLRSIDEVVSAAYGRGGLPTVAIVGGENEEALLAAKMASHEGAPRLARFILVGPYGRISQLAWELEVPIDDDNFIIVDSVDPVEPAIELLEAGLVDTIMKGSITTSGILKGYLRSLKRRRIGGESLLLSHLALFEIPGRSKLVALTDAAINPNPTLPTRLQILENAITALKLMGIMRPKVAVISATEKTSDKVKSSVEGEKIAAQMGGRRDLIIEGPISVDLALSPESATEKGYGGRIQGDADLLLAPNIDVGNAVYKAFTVTSGATVAASVLGGDIPIILTSRGDAARGKHASIALTLVLARKAKEEKRSS